MTYNPPAYTPTTYCAFDGPYEIIFRKIYNHNQKMTMFFASIFHARDILSSSDLIDFKNYLCHSMVVRETNQLIQWGFEDYIMTLDHISPYHQECSAVLSNEPLCGIVDENGNITQLHHNAIVPLNLFRKAQTQDVHYVGYPQRTPCVKPNAYWIVLQNPADCTHARFDREILFEENTVSYYDKNNYYLVVLKQLTLNYAKYLQSFGIDCVAKQLINGNKAAYCIEISPEQMDSFELFRRLAQ